jgi:glycosyltransferase involved in cell wall biosynthesis
LSNLISVITINLNNSLGLKKTINSVLSQDYSNIEYIIIDGDSSDGSLEIIQSVSSKLAYFISEKDEGIYSAMNKGIIKANGEYLIFLNSGDYFASPSSISSLKMNTISKSIIYGNMLIEQNGELSIEKYPHRVDLNFFLG